MAQLRNLQIFRNGELLTGSVAFVKGLINDAFTGGKIALNDGEPISIRYKETNESTEIKSLFGVAYVNGDNKSILWTPNPSDLVLDTAGDGYVNIDYVVNEETGNYTLTVDAITKSIKDATAEGETVDGLATALDVKNYVTEQIGNINIPEYTIQALNTAEEGHLKTYQLFKDNVAIDGSVINIPKDYLVKSASIKTVSEVDKAEGGIFHNNDEYKIGDKYFDFVINTKVTDGGEDEHLYINAKNLVDTYTAGNGININEENQISVIIPEDEKYITVDENGIHTTDELKSAIKSAYTKGDDIEITDDNKINVSLSNAITPNTTVGFVNPETTIEAGSSLEEILRKILVKEVLATSVNPTNSLSVSGDSKREVGTPLGTVTLTPSYTDGYYKSSDTNVYTDDQFNTNNPGAKNGKLNAGCGKGEVTYYKGETTITDQVDETDGFQYVDNTKVTTNTTYSFQITTAYNASTVNECKTSSGATQTISIPSGTTPKSSAVTVSFYHKTYVSSIQGLVWDAAKGYLVKDGVQYVPETTLKNTMTTNGELLTSTTQNKNEETVIPATSSLCIIVPKGVTFTIYSKSDSSQSNLFNQFKKYETTNDYTINYDIYIYCNNGDAAFTVAGLTYNKIQ